jgi:hypothetical protein
MDDLQNIIKQSLNNAILFVTNWCFVVSGRHYVVSLKGDRLPTREAAPVLVWNSCSQLWVVYLYKDKNYIIYHNNNKVYNNIYKRLVENRLPTLPTIALSHAAIGLRRRQSL